MDFSTIMGPTIYWTNTTTTANMANSNVVPKPRYVQINVIMAYKIPKSNAVANQIRNVNKNFLKLNTLFSYFHE